MQNPTSASFSTGPRPVAADRRTRVRLRELCDEVIASFRVAADRDVISDAERAEAQAMLAGMIPLRARR